MNYFSTHHRDNAYQRSQRRYNQFKTCIKAGGIINYVKSIWHLIACAIHTSIYKPFELLTGKDFQASAKPLVKTLATPRETIKAEQSLEKIAAELAKLNEFLAKVKTEKMPMIVPTSVSAASPAPMPAAPPAPVRAVLPAPEARASSITTTNVHEDIVEKQAQAGTIAREIQDMFKTKTRAEMLKRVPASDRPKDCPTTDEEKASSIPPAPPMEDYQAYLRTRVIPSSNPN